MRDTLLKEILTEYDALRYQEEQALRDRRAEVYEKIPQLKALHNDMITALADHSRALIANPQQTGSLTRVEAKIAALREKKASLLAENGFPRDYLEHRYRCTVCKDTGFTGDLVKEKCRCLIQKLIDRTYKLSQMQELKAQNFDTFDPDVFPDLPLKKGGPTQRAYMLKIRDELVTWQEQFPDNPRKNILFTGQTGLGKTFLLNCIAKAVLDKGYSVLKTTSYNLFEELFRCSFRNDNRGSNLIDGVFNADLLIIDDLGTETKRNNYTVEELFNILNERGLDAKHTILSTNLKLTELKEWYSERISSRLFDTSTTIIIRFLGQDIRIVRNKQE